MISIIIEGPPFALSLSPVPLPPPPASEGILKWREEAAKNVSFSPMVRGRKILAIKDSDMISAL